MAGNNGGQVPRFGDWKATDGGEGQFTMYFENARKQRKSPSGIAPPPEVRPARMGTIPAAHRTPPAADVNPGNPKDRTNRSRSQGMSGNGGTVPTWGQWNEGNSGGGAQQYTLVFDQLREERKSAPPTPSIEELQRRTPPRPTRHDLYDHEPKKFTCFGMCLK